MAVALGCGAEQPRTVLQEGSDSTCIMRDFTRGAHIFLIAREYRACEGSFSRWPSS